MGFRVQGSGCRLKGSVYEVWGLGFSTHVLNFHEDVVVHRQRAKFRAVAHACRGEGFLLKVLCFRI